MAIQNVKQLCSPSEIVQSDSLVDQIAELSDLRDGKIDADAFFRRNHFTEGLERLLYNGFKRLSGETDVGAYYLSQSMGGGKTHSLITFALLAENPSARQRVVPSLAALCKFDKVRTVVFNGHDSPENFLWGFVADQLGKPERFARFWKDGARTPGKDDWVDLIGDEPTLILLDELPSYLQMAQAQTVGATDLANVTTGALERLFAALPHLPKTCILMTNLKDDVYRQGAAAVKDIIDNLSKQAGKYAEAITPVQQNSTEVFQIIRKKLFDGLPDEDRIDEVAQAYVDALSKAKKLDSVTITPETFLQRIRETYPFHPSIRDIVARFKENSGYQQTRALIRILRHAVRAVWASEGNTFLIGLQHLNFNQFGVIEEIRKINPTFTNAISRDVADGGNALAERIDDAKGSHIASEVAKLLLMSSLSTAENPILGLRENEVVEFSIDPLGSVSEIKTALDGLREKAWYLFRSAGDDRIFFGNTANVIAQIQDVAVNTAEEVVDKELRKKLLDVFAPKDKKCYQNVVFALPSLDELKTDEEHVRLVILERPANQLPPEFEAWWKNDERPNRVLVLTADTNAVGTLRALAREFHAIAAVKKAVVQRNGADSTQYREVSDYETTAANRFTSALRETFKTIVFPVKGKLREVRDFEMRFDNNDYSGEQQIVDALVKRGKYYTEELFDKNIESLRLEAEDELFDAKAVPEGELRRKAAARPGWFWLPPKGLDRLIRECCSRQFWRQNMGVVEKGPFAKVTAVKVALEETRDDGLYVLSVSPLNGDAVVASETGVPDASSAKVQGGRWETYGPAVTFLALDSKGEATTGDPVEWKAQFEIRPSLESKPEGWQLTVAVRPKSAEVLASFDGTSPKDGQPVTGPVILPSDCQRVRLIARAGGRWSDEANSVTVPVKGGGGGGGGQERPKAPRDDLPVLLKSRHGTNSTKDTYTVLEAFRAVGGAKVVGGKIDLKGATDKAWAKFSFGDEVSVPSEEVAQMLERLKALSGIEEASLGWNKVRFETGRAFVNFAGQAGLDWERQEWEHDSLQETA